MEKKRGLTRLFVHLGHQPAVGVVDALCAARNRRRETARTTLSVELEESSSALCQGGVNEVLQLVGRPRRPTAIRNASN